MRTPRSFRRYGQTEVDLDSMITACVFCMCHNDEIFVVHDSCFFAVEKFYLFWRYGSVHLYFCTPMLLSCEADDEKMDILQIS